MRFAPGVPITVRPSVAVTTVALTMASIVTLWSQPVWWWRASAAIPLLSAWGFAAALQLVLALGVIIPTLRPTLSELGLAPRQVLAALGAALAIWTVTHVVQLVDITCSGRVMPPEMDVIGDGLGAYAEELVYRVVVLGAIATALRRRMSERRALVVAILGSTLLFWAAHLPRDVVTGKIADPMTFAFLLGHGLLLAAVYLASGNVMLAAVVHALSNGPMLVIAGAHHKATTSNTNWICCVALVLWYQRRHQHSVNAARRRCG